MFAPIDRMKNCLPSICVFCSDFNCGNTVPQGGEREVSIDCSRSASSSASRRCCKDGRYRPRSRSAPWCALPRNRRRPASADCRRSFSRKRGRSGIVIARPGEIDRLIVGAGDATGDRHRGQRHAGADQDLVDLPPTQRAFLQAGQGIPIFSSWPLPVCMDFLLILLCQQPCHDTAGRATAGNCAAATALAAAGCARGVAASDGFPGVRRGSRSPVPNRSPVFRFRS